MADSFTFNDKATPKVKTENVKYYYNVGTSSVPSWELQGRGIESWTEEMGADIEKKTDVLGFVDMERAVPQRTQSGVPITIRKGSKFAEKIVEAEYTGDWSFFDNVEILKKYEFLDGTETSNCKAKLEKEVMMTIVNMTAEAGSYISYEVDIHYSNNTTLGEMAKVDSESISFEPKDGA